MTTRVDLLVEIGTEEIPARFLPSAAQWCRERLAALLAELALNPSAVTVEYTTRRLVFAAAGVLVRQADRQVEVFGPPVKVAFDSEGRPTKAALGFAKTNGVQPEALQRATTDKGEVIKAVQFKAGGDAALLLSDALPRLLADIPWPKRMRWGSEAQAFVRPVHWIVALLGTEVLPLRFAGVESDRFSRGHFFAAPESFAVATADIDALRAELRRRFVILSQEERRALVLKGVQALAARIGGTLLKDDELVEETADLVEFPGAALGDIDVRYLTLPRDLLVVTMKTNQRYFCFEDADGRLLAHFGLITNNPDPAAYSAIVAGNQRVLKGRLDDGGFFVTEDSKKPLIDFAEELDRVTFQRQLGSIGDKVRRFTMLAQRIVSMIPADQATTAAPLLTRACLLAKADLNTQAVFEFPELQGVMGRFYAAGQNEDPAIAIAIESHWRPRFSGDEPAADILGALVALADKLDTIAGCFAVGLKPTGAKDAFALRRQSLGCIQTVLARQWETVSLAVLIDEACALVSDKSPTDPAENAAQVKEFFTARFEQLMVDQGFPRDVVQAVIAAGLDNPVSSRRKVEALHRFSQKEDYAHLAAAFKRVGNILAKQGEEYTAAGSPAVDPALLQQAEERALYEAVSAMAGTVLHAVADGAYGDAFEALAALRPQVDAFFDGVLVMCEDTAVRLNRIALLDALRRLFADLADFRKVAVKG